MDKIKPPWTGCGASKDITGCRFTLSVMADNYVEQILGAIGRVDIGNVWSQTDALSTIYRGRRIHVVDAARAVFVHINDRKTHSTMEATFSKGCPGDVDADSYLAHDDTLLNPREVGFDVRAKIAFYPLGAPDYMEQIAHVANMAVERGLYQNASHYASELRGDVNALFDYFHDVLAYAEAHIDHYVLQVTLSVNSPTKQ